MTDTKSKDGLRSIGLMLIALFVGALFLLPPVKTWLNSNPIIWQMLYPALSLFAGYGLVMSLREKDRARGWLPWLIMLLAALSATLWAYGAGLAFYTLGRNASIAFVLLEVTFTILDVVKPESA